MKFDSLRYDDTLEAFNSAAKKILRKNASQNRIKRAERECDLLNQYNELVLLTQQVDEINDKQVIDTVHKRTLEAREKLAECSEFLIVEIKIPSDIFSLIAFKNPSIKEIRVDSDSEAHYSLKEWIDKQYELHTNKNAPIQPHQSNSKSVTPHSNDNLNNNKPDGNSDAHLNTNSKENSHSKQNKTNSIMDLVAFSSLMAANIRNNFNGKQEQLAPFLASIDYLREMATSEPLKILLLKFVRTKLEGYASEIVPEDVDSIDALMKCLRDKIKPENSKVVEGRMMALQSSRLNMQDFSKQVEELSDSFRRALIADGMPNLLAERQVIDKTIELCRNSTQSVTVKSILAATQFSTPKEVVAKFVVETNTSKQEAQILSLRQFQNRNFRGRFNANQQKGNRANGRFANNGNRQNNYNGNRRYNNYNNSNGNNNNNYNRQNQNQNNNSQQGGSYRGRGGNYRGGNRGGNQNRSVRVVENSTATQSTLGTAEE